jgi:hypothetical protein
MLFDSHQLTRERVTLALLILFYIVICCLSLVSVTQLYGMFYLTYHPARLPGAVVAVAVLTPGLLFFTFARFSFGYFVGFYFYTMVVGYLWLIFFSDLHYNRPLAGLSAAASLVVFLLPALFI